MPDLDPGLLLLHLLIAFFFGISCRFLLLLSPDDTSRVFFYTKMFSMCSSLVHIRRTDELDTWAARHAKWHHFSRLTLLSCNVVCHNHMYIPRGTVAKSLNSPAASQLGLIPESCDGTTGRLLFNIQLCKRSKL